MTQERYDSENRLTQEGTIAQPPIFYVNNNIGIRLTPTQSTTTAILGYNYEY